MANWRLLRALALITAGATAMSPAAALALAALIGAPLDGRHIALSVMVPVILTPIWVLPLLLSNHKLARLKRELEQLALTDALSNLPNRRAFFARTGQLLGQARSRTEPMTVMMIDIDHFKAINDSHGHEAGDRVIAAIAALLRAALRETGLADQAVIARIGGEEFGLGVRGLDAQRGLALAEEICRRVRCHAVAYGAATLRATVSVGVATSLVEADLSAQLRAADHAVYAAKRAGRDRPWLADRSSRPAGLPDLPEQLRLPLHAA